MSLKRNLCSLVAGGAILGATSGVGGYGPGPEDWDDNPPEVPADPVQSCIDQHPTTPHNGGFGLYELVRPYVGPVITDDVSGPDAQVMFDDSFHNYHCTLDQQWRINTVMTTTHHVGVGGGSEVGVTTSAAAKAAVFAEVKAEAHANVYVNAEFNDTQTITREIEATITVGPGETIQYLETVDKYSAQARAGVAEALGRCWSPFGGPNGTWNEWTCGGSGTVSGNGYGDERGDHYVIPTGSGNCISSENTPDPAYRHGGETGGPGEEFP